MGVNNEEESSGSRLISRREMLKLTLAGAAGLAAAACAGPPAPTPPTPTPTRAPAVPLKKEVIVVQSADPPHLDPAMGLMIHVFNPAQNLMDTLSHLDHDLKVLPRLAISWKPLDDLTWEVKLREGVKFHDGRTCDAAAAKASFDYMTDKETPARTFFANWESLEVVNPSTIKVKTKKPEPYFPNVLTRFWVFPPDILQVKKEFGAKPVGTGPYKLVEYVRGERVTLEVNPNYWGPKPAIERVIFKAAPEASARVAMLQAGQADIIVNVPVEQAKIIEASEKLRLATVASLRRIPIMIDGRKGPPLSDKRVRQAMNYAVDKETIVKTILGGYAVVAPATISPLIEGYNPNVKPYPYDPDKAKALLKEAGWGDGFAVDFHHPTGRWMKDVEVAQAIGSQLGKVGIKTSLLTAEYSTFFGTWSKGEYSGMSMIGTTNPDGAPYSMYRLFLYSKGPWPFSVTDPKLDAMIEQAEATMDRDKRVKLYQEMEVFVQDLAPWIFTHDQKDIYGVNKALKWKPTPHELIYLWDASF